MELESGFIGFATVNIFGDMGVFEIRWIARNSGSPASRNHFQGSFVAYDTLIATTQLMNNRGDFNSG